jgi:hypothetical protein
MILSLVAVLLSRPSEQSRTRPSFTIKLENAPAFSLFKTLPYLFSPALPRLRSGSLERTENTGGFLKGYSSKEKQLSDLSGLCEKNNKTFFGSAIKPLLQVVVIDPPARE